MSVTTRTSGRFTCSIVFRARELASTSNEDVDLSRGLKDIHEFEVRGLFDLIEPTVDGERYGVRLVDFGVASPNDTVQLSVDRSLAGEWRVNFLEADFDLGVFNIPDSYSLTGVAGIGDHEQIALMLTKGDAASKLIDASFELIDLDGLLSNVAVSMSGNASLFDGERWTRAAFFAGVPREVAVPVPPTLLLMIVGLVALNRVSRR